MKNKKVKTKVIALAFCMALLVAMSGMVSAATLESVTTIGQAVPVPTPLQELEHSYVTTGTFTSFNIDVGEKFRSGSAVTPDSKTVYVMNYDPTISVIDATIDQFIKTIVLSSVSPGLFSGGVVVGNKLYAVGSSKVVIMDTSTEQIVNSIPQSPGGGVVWGRAVASPTKDRVYTVFGCVRTMLAIDTSTYQLIGSADIGNENTGVDVSLSGDKIYTSDRINGNLTIVDANDFSIIDVKSFITGTGIIPHTTAVAVGQDGLVYVGYVDGNGKFCVAILDSDGNLIDTITTTGWSTGLEISMDGKYLITGNGNIIDVNTKTVIADVSTGSGEYQVDVSPDGLRAYVTNYNSDYVTVIEGFEPITPSVTIETDKIKYSPGDAMTITLDISNPTEESVTFQWYWGVPLYSIWVPVGSASIPAGYNDTTVFSFTIPNWGPTPFGNVFYAQLLDASGEILDANCECWAYMQLRDAEGEVLDADCECWCKCWAYMQLRGAGGEVLDADCECWAYNPSGEAMPTVDIGEKIKKTIEKIDN